MSHNIIHEIADTYRIGKGKQESQRDYYARIVYSVCGLMAYTSLLDDPQDDQSAISKIHLKRRIKAILDSYLDLYPELVAIFNPAKQDLAEIIFDSYLETGLIYNSPYRLAQSNQMSTSFSSLITFERGIAPDAIQAVSGLGFYSLDPNFSEYTVRYMKLPVAIAQCKQIRDEFGLHTDRLAWDLDGALAHAHWESGQRLKKLSVEYLKMTGPFTDGFWLSAPDPLMFSSKLKAKIAKLRAKQRDKQEAANSNFNITDAAAALASHFSSSTISRADNSTNATDTESQASESSTRSYVPDIVSILRNGKDYYLFGYVDDDSEMLISPLPKWMGQFDECRTLCFACLQLADNIPAILYSIDGAIVHIKLQYQLPRSEMNLIKLYSWPKFIDGTFSDTERTMTAEVFHVLSRLLSLQGYRLHGIPFHKLYPSDNFPH